MITNIRHYVDVEIVKTANILIIYQSLVTIQVKRHNFAANKDKDTESCLGLNSVELYLLHEVRQIHIESSVCAVMDPYNDVCT